MQALESACTEAVRPARCTVDDVTTADVRIEWTTARTATVTVRGSTTLTRALTFREEDPPGDEWRALGLVAAALVNRAAAESEPEVTRPAPAERPPKLWLTGGAILGAGLSRGPVSFGGTLRGGYRLPIPVFVGASGSYATAGRGPDGLRGTWTTFSLDASGVVDLPSVRLRPRLELVLDRLVAETSGGPMGGTSGSRQLVGAGAGFDAVWPSTERFALVLGAEGTFLSSGTQIRVDADRISAFPALSYRFFVGIDVTVLP
ncbi:MAG TPA: hypothetical protein VH062_37160 [Polyangiaceae bacterium]|nr:hypothetical protein [Polyangiaceae bacterium]